MRTKVEVVIDIVKQTIIAVQHLAGANHSSKEIGEYVQNAGAAVELFLKDAVFPGRSSSGFYELIENLSVFGMSPIGVMGLHSLRLKYNSFKHNPNIGISIFESLQAMEDALTALQELVKIGPSSLHSPLPRTYKRVLWIVGWDHFNSGDTEVHVIVPYTKGNFFTVLDYYNIKWGGWQKVVDRFVAEDSLMMGQGSFPLDVYSRFEEGDFIDAGVFSGDYRELVLELSKWVDYTHDEELLPVLSRKNDPVSIFTAVLFAVMEVLSKDRYGEDISAFSKELIAEAEFQYGADRSSVYIESFVTDIANLIVPLDDTVRSNLIGPIWVTAEKFEQLKTTALAHSVSFRVLISQDCELTAAV